MSSRIRDGDSSRRRLRHFAWIIALAVGLATRYCPPAQRGYLALAAAVIFSLGTVLPAAFRWPYKLALTGFYPFQWLATIIFFLAINLNMGKFLTAFSRIPGRLFFHRHRQTTSAAQP